MGKKTDPEIHLDGKQERWWCPRCQKSKATDRSHCDCPHCGDPMMRMIEWVRRQARLTGG